MEFSSSTKEGAGFEVDVSDLNVFVVVARHKNISSAAREICLSQPAVSNKIRRVEQFFRTALLTRSNYGVSLTPTGARVLEHLEPILSDMRRIEAKYGPSRDEVAARPLRVGGTSTISGTILPDILIAFRKENPRLDFIVESGDIRVIEKLVMESMVEIALVASYEKKPKCPHELFMAHEACAFVPPDSELLGKRLTLAELTKHPLVVRKGSSIMNHLILMGESYHLSAQFSAIEPVKRAVQGGIGVGILFKSRLVDELASGGLKPLDIPELNTIILRSYIIYRDDMALSAVAKNFLTFLRNMRDGNNPGRRHLVKG